MPRNPIPQNLAAKEHDTLGEFAECAARCKDLALQMSKLRPDRGDDWQKIAAMMQMLSGQAYDLATGGLLTREDGKFGGGKLS